MPGTAGTPSGGFWAGQLSKRNRMNRLFSVALDQIDKNGSPEKAGGRADVPLPSPFSVMGSLRHCLKVRMSC